METTLYQVNFIDGRIYRVFCQGKNQKKRFSSKIGRLSLLGKIKDITEITNGIHTITEFEKLKE